MPLYTRCDGTRDALVLGECAALGVRGLDLAKARGRGGELKPLYQSGVTDLREHPAALEQAERGPAARAEGSTAGPRAR